MDVSTVGAGNSFQGDLPEPGIKWQRTVLEEYAKASCRYDQHILDDIGRFQAHGDARIEPPRDKTEERRTNRVQEARHRTAVPPDGSPQQDFEVSVRIDHARILRRVSLLSVPSKLA